MKPLLPVSCVLLAVVVLVAACVPLPTPETAGQGIAPAKDAGLRM